jgi:hypothetical protein
MKSVCKCMRTFSSIACKCKGTVGCKKKFNSMAHPTPPHPAPSPTPLHPAYAHQNAKKHPRKQDGLLWPVVQLHPQLWGMPGISNELFGPNTPTLMWFLHLAFNFQTYFYDFLYKHQAILQKKQPKWTNLNAKSLLNNNKKYFKFSLSNTDL